MPSESLTKEPVQPEFAQELRSIDREISRLKEKRIDITSCVNRLRIMNPEANQPDAPEAKRGAEISVIENLRVFSDLISNENDRLSRIQDHLHQLLG